MDSFIAIGLILIFFPLSFFTKRLLSWRGMPYIYGALMIFFLVNAVISKGHFYGNLLVAIFALGFTIKSIKQVKASKTVETE